MKSKKKMGGCTARIYAQNFDAVLVVIIISAGDAIFAKLYIKNVQNTQNYTFYDIGHVIFSRTHFF